MQLAACNTQSSTGSNDLIPYRDIAIVVVRPYIKFHELGCPGKRDIVQTIFRFLCFDSTYCSYYSELNSHPFSMISISLERSH